MRNKRRVKGARTPTKRCSPSPASALAFSSAFFPEKRRRQHTPVVPTGDGLLITMAKSSSGQCKERYRRSDRALHGACEARGLCRRRQNPRKRERRSSDDRFKPSGTRCNPMERALVFTWSGTHGVLWRHSCGQSRSQQSRSLRYPYQPLERARTVRGARTTALVQE